MLTSPKLIDPFHVVRMSEEVYGGMPWIRARETRLLPGGLGAR